MKITEEYIQFGSASQVKSFVDKYSLEQERFEFEFASPVHSNGGEVYIPVGISVNEGMLEKLHNFDSFNDYYRILNNKKTIRFYILHLRKVFFDLLKRSHNEFLMVLYEGVPGGAISGIITHAFYDSHNNKSFGFILWLLELYEKNRDLFFSLARGGLYALGTAFTVHKRQSYLHRYAFQMGLVADINSQKANLFESALVDQDPSAQRNYCEQSAQEAIQLGLPEPIVEALRLHLDTTELLEQATQDEKKSRIESNQEEDIEGEDQDGGKEAKLAATNRALGRALLSIMRLVRYFTDSEKVTKDLEMRQRNIIGGLSYLSEKGMLPNMITVPILKKCKEHKELIAKMKKIAQVELACTKKDPDAAWAYPKPDATQVICLKNHTDCANFINGRPLYVLGMGDASLLRFQMPGEFNKCRLAETF